MLSILTFCILFAVLNAYKNNIEDSEINFFIACDLDTKTNFQNSDLQANYKLQSDSQNFILNQNNCTELQSYSNPEINIFIIYEYQQLSFCDLKQINVDLENCLEFNLNIQPALFQDGEFSLYQENILENLLFKDVQLNIKSLLQIEMSFITFTDQNQNLLIEKINSTLIMQNVTFAQEDILTPITILNYMTIQYIQQVDLFNFQFINLINEQASDVKLISAQHIDQFNYSNCISKDIQIQQGTFFKLQEITTVKFNNNIVENIKANNFKLISFSLIEDLEIQNYIVKDIQSLSSFYALHITDDIDRVIIKNSTFLNISTVQSIIYLQGYVQYFEVDDCIFEQLMGNTGMIILINDVENSNIKRSTFNSITSSNSGTFITIYDLDQFSISDCNFSNNKVENGIVNIKNMYKSSGNYNIYVNNTIFHNNTGEYNGIYISSAQIPIIFNNITVSENKKGQSIYLYYIQKTVKIINSNFFKNEYEEKSGSCLYTYYLSQLILDNINISYNLGYKSNVYLYYSSDLTFTNSLVHNNTGYSSSGIFVNYAWKSEFYNLTFTKNYAEDEVSAFNCYICDNSVIHDMNFEDNISGNTFGAFLLEYSYYDEVRDLTFKRNQAQQKGTSFALITAYKSTFKNILIQDSVALGQNGALYIEQGSYVDFYNVTIFNCTTDDKNGGGIYAYMPKLYTLINSTFYDNYASIGGAVSIYSAQNFTLKNIDFTNNSARSYGGALHIDKGESYLNNITFYGNQVDQHGGAMYVESTRKVEILNSSFKNNQCSSGDGGAIKIFNGFEVFINNSIIAANQAQLGSGGAINVDQVRDLRINNTIINNNMKSILGGALYLYNFQQVLINNTQIYGHKDNTQIQGGAVYLSTGTNASFVNTQISNNMAQYYGGAVFSMALQNLLFQNTIIESNLVDTNQEDIKEKGGALYIDQIDNITIDQATFYNNKAYELGGAINLIDAQILNIRDSTFEQNSVYYDKDLYQFQKQQGYVITKGGAISFTTKYMETINKIQILVKNVNFKKNYASSGGGILIQLDPGFQTNPDFSNLNFEDNIADIGPGIRFLGDNEDYFENLNQQSDIKSQNNLGIIQPENIYWTFTMYEKKIEESTNQFNLCDSGYFIKTLKSTTCENCVDNAVCKGGYIPLYPDKHYWRPNTVGIDLYYCENYDEACPGNDTCKIGHTGPLCESCDIFNGYGPYGIQCEKCTSEDFMVILKVSLLSICILVIICYQIYGIRKRIQKRQLSQIFFNIWDYPINTQSNLSGIIKIAILHCQIIYLIASFTLNVPFEVISFFEIIGNPQTTLSTNLVCILSRDIEDINDLDKINYKISVYALFLISILLIVALLIEIILHVCFKFFQNQNQFIDYVKCSIICFLITVQPGILQNSLEFVKCRDIAGIKYSSADLFVQCDSDFFTTIIFPINMTLIVLLGVIIPGAFVYILVKGYKKNMLKKYSFQRRFGVLFIELKSQYYFWDVVTMVLKLFAVGFSIIFSEDIARKGILVNLILTIYLILCNTFKPFITQKLNKLQVHSVVAQIFTISIGICMNTLQENEQIVEQILSLVIIFINGLYGIMSFLYIFQEFRIHLYTYLYKFRNRLPNFINHRVQTQINRFRVTKLRWIKLRLLIRSFIKNEKGKSHIAKSFVQDRIFQSLSKEANQTTGQELFQKKRLTAIDQQLSNHRSQMISQSDLQTPKQKQSQQNQSQNFSKFFLNINQDNSKLQTNDIKISLQKVNCDNSLTYQTQQSEKKLKDLIFQNQTQTVEPNKITNQNQIILQKSSSLNNNTFIKNQLSKMQLEKQMTENNKLRAKKMGLQNKRKLQNNQSLILNKQNHSQSLLNFSPPHKIKQSQQFIFDPALSNQNSSKRLNNNQQNDQINDLTDEQYQQINSTNRKDSQSPKYPVILVKDDIQYNQQNDQIIDQNQECEEQNQEFSKSFNKNQQQQSSFLSEDKETNFDFSNIYLDKKISQNSIQTPQYQSLRQNLKKKNKNETQNSIQKLKDINLNEKQTQRKNNYIIKQINSYNNMDDDNICGSNGGSSNKNSNIESNNNLMINDNYSQQDMTIEFDQNNQSNLNLNIKNKSMQKFNNCRPSGDQYQDISFDFDLQ